MHHLVGAGNVPKHNSEGMQESNKYCKVELPYHDVPLPELKRTDRKRRHAKTRDFILEEMAMLRSVYPSRQAKPICD